MLARTGVIDCMTGQVIEVSRHILSLYELWKNYDEKKEIPALLGKMPKPKLSPSR